MVSGTLREPRIAFPGATNCQQAVSFGFKLPLVRIASQFAIVIISFQAGTAATRASVIDLFCFRDRFAANPGFANASWVG